MHNNTVQDPDPVLREVAKEVPVEEISSSEIQDVIKRMKEGIRTHDDGGVNVGYAVAIAAPQIGESYRIFLVDGIAFMTYEEIRSNKERPDDKVFINPVITKTSSKKKPRDEGCLSVNYGNSFGLVERYAQVTVQAYDEFGNKFEHGASGSMAQIFQHEIDHLDGILFIDKVKDLRTYEKDAHEEK